MKTVEEFRSMTQEDLVRYAQGLQEMLETERKEVLKYKSWWCETNQKYEDFKKMLSVMLNLTK